MADVTAYIEPEPTANQAHVELILDAPVVYAYDLIDLSSPAPAGPTTTAVNRVWDDSVSKFVLWTTETPDTSGSNYPGPGTWGVDTSNYCVVVKE